MLMKENIVNAVLLMFEQDLSAYDTLQDKHRVVIMDLAIAGTRIKFCGEKGEKKGSNHEDDGTEAKGGNPGHTTSQDEKGGTGTYHPENGGLHAVLWHIRRPMRA